MNTKFKPSSCLPKPYVPYSPDERITPELLDYLHEIDERKNRFKNRVKECVHAISTCFGFIANAFPFIQDTMSGHASAINGMIEYNRANSSLSGFSDDVVEHDLFNGRGPIGNQIYEHLTISGLTAKQEKMQAVKEEYLYKFCFQPYRPTNEMHEERQIFALLDILFNICKIHEQIPVQDSSNKPDVIPDGFTNYGDSKNSPFYVWSSTAAHHHVVLNFTIASFRKHPVKTMILIERTGNFFTDIGYRFSTHYKHPFEMLNANGTHENFVLPNLWESALPVIQNWVQDNYRSNAYGEMAEDDLGILYNLIGLSEFGFMADFTIKIDERRVVDCVVRKLMNDDDLHFAFIIKSTPYCEQQFNYRYMLEERKVEAIRTEKNTGVVYEWEAEIFWTVMFDKFISRCREVYEEKLKQKQEVKDA